MKDFNILMVYLFILGLSGSMTAQECEENITLQNETITIGQARLIEANNSITALNYVIQGNGSNGGVVALGANEQVRLRPGFQAQRGSTLIVSNDGCTPLPPPIAVNDPLFEYQWGHANEIADITEVLLAFNGDTIHNPGYGADVLGAWNITTGSPDITIAVLDSGLDVNHPDLDPDRILPGYNAVDGTGNIVDIFGHGTHTAGLIAAEVNDIGIAGIDQHCKILPIKVNMDDEASTIVHDSIPAAIDTARARGSKIISMSFGTTASFELEESLRRAIDENILILAATGNDDSTLVDFPAIYTSVVGVGAASPCSERKNSVNNDPNSCDNDPRDNEWGSNFGEGLDFLAPGTLLGSIDVRGLPNGLTQFESLGRYRSAFDGDYVLDAFGTSIATPFAAGIASLVWSVNENFKAYQVREIMRGSTRNGIINAKNAVELATIVNPENFALMPNLTLIFKNFPTSVNFDNGEEFIGTFQVVNNGDIAAPASILAYESNANENGFFNIPILEPGAISQVFTISTNCASQVDNIIFNFTIDAENQVDEFNEFNRFRRELEIIGTPDLTIDPNSVFKEINSSTLNISYDILNIGNAETPGISNPNFFRYYFSDDNIIDENDSVPGAQSISLFSIDCTEIAINQSIPIPNGVITNYVIIEIDAINNISESNENNNTLAVCLTNCGPIISDGPKGGRAQESQLQVYPNPATERITISDDNSLNGMLTIYDQWGNTRYQGVTVKSAKTHTIDVSRYKTGLYFIEYVDSKGGRKVKTFIKK